MQRPNRTSTVGEQTTAAEPQVAQHAAPRSDFARMIQRVFSNRLAYVGAIGCSLMILVAVLGPEVVPQGPFDQSMLERFEPPSSRHWLGTDEFGRDTLSRVVYATRISVLISLASVLIGMMTGTLIGIIAGYRRGWIDWVATEFANLFLAFPTIVLGILVLVSIGSGGTNIIIALSLAFAPRFIRLARAETMSIAERAMIESARASGASELRIMMRHILPNVLGTAVVSAALWTATAIRAEAALSFIGLGVQPPNPSWGNMISGGLIYILDSPALTVYPAIAIMIAVVSVNALGDALRDVFDPRIYDH